MSLLFKSLVFVLVTAALTWVSLPSLRDCRAHGFYRFFAWEAILGLILLNLESWFDEPFSFRQLTSWSLLVISGYLAIHGTLILHRIGKPSRERRDPLLYDLEKTTRLATSGIYRYIRHPMYSSLLFLAWGVYFKNPGLVSICLVVAASGFLIATARVEERENVRYFGVAYHDYMKQTRMFVPYLF
jgi:protein-S-isoprenylcysteine O-methyltransferase Ste14